MVNDFEIQDAEDNNAIVAFLHGEVVVTFHEGRHCPAFAAFVTGVVNAGGSVWDKNYARDIKLEDFA